MASSVRKISSLPGLLPEAKALVLSPRPGNSEVNVRENCLRLRSWEFTGILLSTLGLASLKP